jgi:hypothetical protein
MSQASDPAIPTTLRHSPTFGAWADENHDRPIAKCSMFVIRSRHDCLDAAAAFTEGGASVRTTAYEVAHRSAPQDPWSPFGVHLQSPGFTLYAYSLALCQWFYFVVNAIERGVALETVSLEFEVHATDAYFIRELRARYDVGLTAGSTPPADGDLAHIVERAKLCPVSRNVGGSFDEVVTCTFSVRSGCS